MSVSEVCVYTSAQKNMCTSCYYGGVTWDDGMGVFVFLLFILLVLIFILSGCFATPVPMCTCGARKQNDAFALRD